MRENLIAAIDRFLTKNCNPKFTKVKDEECWNFKKEAVQKAVAVVNGQEQEIEVGRSNILFKVQVVGDGDISGTPITQILFEVSKDDNILMEYEEAFYHDGFEQFLERFTTIF